MNLRFLPLMITFSLAAGIYPSMASELSNCMTSRTRLSIEAAQEAMPEVVAQNMELTAENLENELKTCETQECIEQKLSPVRQRLKGTLDKLSCLKRHPSAISSMMSKLSVIEASWISTWLAPAIFQHKYDWKEFPAEYVSANLILAPILTAIACKNIFESGKPGDPPVGLKDVDWAYIKRSMASNVKVLGIASVSVVGVKATIDRKVRKKKVPLARYAADALLLAIDQTGRGNLSDVSFVDTFLKTDLPRRVESLIGTVSGIKGIAATTALGVGPLYAYKSLEYYFLSNIYMKLLETPTEKLMTKSADELEKLFKSDIYCLPDDAECAKYRQRVVTHPPLPPASGGQ